MGLKPSRKWRFIMVYPMSGKDKNTTLLGKNGKGATGLGISWLITSNFTRVYFWAGHLKQRNNVIGVISIESIVDACRWEYNWKVPPPTPTSPTNWIRVLFLWLTPKMIPIDTSFTRFGRIWSWT
jgi:hypothetical protein